MGIDILANSQGATGALTIDGNSLARIDATTFGARLEQVRGVRLSDLHKDITIRLDSSSQIVMIQAVGHQQAAVTYHWSICDLCIFNSRLGRRGFVNAFKTFVRSSQDPDIRIGKMRISEDRNNVVVTAIVEGVTCGEIVSKLNDFFKMIDHRMKTL